MNKLVHYIRRYRYAKTHRMLPELKGAGSGACGQDILVANLLANKRNGVFVDIGANNGVQISNTYYLERALGWTGVAVEPIPRVFDALSKNRSCDVIMGCVTPVSGKAKFLEMVDGPDMLSTLAVNNTGLTARRLRKNARRHNATIREIEVACLTFTDIVKAHGLKEVDFLSLDTEGGELAILKSIDFDATPVRVISVENNYYTNDIREYLERAGYLYLGTFKVDELYLFGGKELAQG